MYFILCSLAVVICFAVQVNSQLAPKRIGEWSPDRFIMYPNPWVNASECRTAETSGLCDYNEILTQEQRKELSEQPEMIVSNKGNLCKNVDGNTRIMVTVAIMKKIGPHITDYRAAAKEFAEKFRTAWNLHNCSVILVASKVDNTSFVEAGSDVVNLLTANVTDRIDRNIYENYSMNGLVKESINAVVSEYRAAAATAQTNESSPIIVGVIIGVIVLLIVIIVVIIVLRAKKRARARNTKEDEHLRGAADV